VHFHAGRLSSGIDRNRHCSVILLTY
jgi:hypothetical protein